MYGIHSYVMVQIEAQRRCLSLGQERRRQTACTCSLWCNSAWFLSAAVILLPFAAFRLPFLQRLRRYLRDGQFNSLPLWTHAGGTNLQVWHNHQHWRLGRTNSYLYVCEDGGNITAGAGPPLGSGWLAAADVPAFADNGLAHKDSRGPPPTLAYME